VTIDELRSQFGISRRTVYWYVESGVIPPPLGGRGKGARYDNRHVEGITAWRALQHNNVISKEALQLCREEGITLYQFMRRKEEAIKTFGLGIA
jgi:DNA-binding transcriptional MerR regulator